MELYIIVLQLQLYYVVSYNDFFFFFFLFGYTVCMQIKSHSNTINYKS